MRRLLLMLLIVIWFFLQEKTTFVVGSRTKPPFGFRSATEVNGKDHHRRHCRRQGNRLQVDKFDAQHKIDSSEKNITTKIVATTPSVDVYIRSRIHSSKKRDVDSVSNTSASNRFKIPLSSQVKTSRLLDDVSRLFHNLTRKGLRKSKLNTLIDGLKQKGNKTKSSELQMPAWLSKFPYNIHSTAHPENSMADTKLGKDSIPKVGKSDVPEKDIATNSKLSITSTKVPNTIQMTPQIPNKDNPAQSIEHNNIPENTQSPPLDPHSHMNLPHYASVNYPEFYGGMPQMTSNPTAPLNYYSGHEQYHPRNPLNNYYLQRPFQYPHSILLNKFPMYHPSGMFSIPKKVFWGHQQRHIPGQLTVSAYIPQEIDDSFNVVRNLDFTNHSMENGNLPDRAISNVQGMQSPDTLEQVEPHNVPNYMASNGDNLYTELVEPTNTEETLFSLYPQSGGNSQAIGKQFPEKYGQSHYPLYANLPENKIHYQNYIPPTYLYEEPQGGTHSHPINVNPGNFATSNFPNYKTRNTQYPVRPTHFYKKPMPKFGSNRPTQPIFLNNQLPNLLRKPNQMPNQFGKLPGYGENNFNDLPLENWPQSSHYPRYREPGFGLYTTPTNDGVVQVKHNGVQNFPNSNVPHGLGYPVDSMGYPNEIETNTNFGNLPSEGILSVQIGPTEFSVQNTVGTPRPPFYYKPNNYKRPDYIPYQNGINSYNTQTVMPVESIMPSNIPYINQPTNPKLATSGTPGKPMDRFRNPVKQNTYPVVNPPALANSMLPDQESNVHSSYYKTTNHDQSPVSINPNHMQRGKVPNYMIPEFNVNYQQSPYQVQSNGFPENSMTDGYPQSQMPQNPAMSYSIPTQSTQPWMSSYIPNKLSHNVQNIAMPSNQAATYLRHPVRPSSTYPTMINQERPIGSINVPYNLNTNNYSAIGYTHQQTEPVGLHHQGTPFNNFGQTNIITRPGGSINTPDRTSTNYIHEGFSNQPIQGTKIPYQMLPYDYQSYYDLNQQVPVNQMNTYDYMDPNSDLDYHEADTLSDGMSSMHISPQINQYNFLPLKMSSSYQLMENDNIPNTSPNEYIEYSNNGNVEFPNDQINNIYSENGMYPWYGQFMGSYYIPSEIQYEHYQNSIDVRYDAAPVDYNSTLENKCSLCQKLPVA